MSSASALRMIQPRDFDFAIEGLPFHALHEVTDEVADDLGRFGRGEEFANSAEVALEEVESVLLEGAALVILSHR